MARPYERTTSCMGKRYWNLLVIEMTEQPGIVKLQCDCGKVIFRHVWQVKRGSCKSCGCRRGENTGKSTSSEWARTYRSWQGMKARCGNPNHKAFKSYGDRGVLVCDEWEGSFSAFLRDMGKRPAGKTLERIDSGLGYFKTNCKWGTQEEQDNNKSNTRRVTVNGKHMSFTQASKLLGFSYWKYYAKIRRNGLTSQQAVDEFLASK